MSQNVIVFPYMPAGLDIRYVSYDDHMKLARDTAQQQSLDKAQQVGCVLVAAGVVLGRGANGSDYHDSHPCERKKLGCKTGEGYELCEGCHPKNHAEGKAIADARKKYAPEQLDALAFAGVLTMYTWGHWWCCADCCKAMAEVGVRELVFLKDSHRLFNREHPANVIGRQFEI